jgi:hypothetical protein
MGILGDASWVSGRLQPVKIGKLTDGLSAICSTVANTSLTGVNPPLLKMCAKLS